MSEDQRRYSDISDREFGYLQSEVQGLKLQNARLEKNQEVMNDKIDLLVHAVTEAKGGWKMIMMVGSASTAMGVFLAKIPLFFRGL